MAGTFTPGTGVDFHYRGTTDGGAPSAGTFAVGDWVETPTGIMVCQLGGSPGVWRGMPQPDAPVVLTQTYSTADPTLATPTTAATATTAATSTTPFGYSEAQANAIVANLNALRADVLDLAQFVNAAVDALQAEGLLA